MSREIKRFSDGTSLEYDRGKIDSWCVYVVEENGKRHAPDDRDYFGELMKISEKYGVEKVYHDFVFIYDLTTKEIKDTVLDDITKLSMDYEEQLEVEKLFVLFYMVFTAEENYPNTKLGRKIKRLAAYEILFNGRDVDNAVNFMRGMKWRDIDELCKERGF